MNVKSHNFINLAFNTNLLLKHNSFFLTSFSYCKYPEESFHILLLGSNRSFLFNFRKKLTTHTAIPKLENFSVNYKLVWSFRFNFSTHSCLKR